MIKLLPEQVAEIQKRIDSLTDSVNNAVNTLKESDDRVAGVGNQGFDYVPDFIPLAELNKSKEELNRLKSILNLAVVVSEYDNTKINIGTRFTVTLNLKGNMRTEECVLVETSVSPILGRIKCISVESPLGSAVYNKKVNDPIKYIIPSTSTLVNGLVDSISPSRLDSKIGNEKSYSIKK